MLGRRLLRYRWEDLVSKAATEAGYLREGMLLKEQPADYYRTTADAYRRGVNKLRSGPPESEKSPSFLSPPKSVEARPPFTISISYESG